MKFFGWERKKEPPPTSHDEPVKRSGYGVSARTGWRSRGIELKDWLPKGHEFEREMAPRSEAPEVAWEDRLQEKIRFVFSHEQEGLLAIGTFALDDLAGARFGLDIIEPSRTSGNPSCCCNSTSSAISSIQHSDVDFDDAALTEFCQQHKRKELPVFGDHDALIDLQAVVESNVQVLPIQVLKPTVTTTNGADTAVGVVTTQKQLQQREEKVCMSGVGFATSEHDDADVEESYSPAICGLFPSRSRRSQSKPVVEKEKQRKKLPPESEANDAKKSVKSKGFCTSLARIWRSGCHGPPATAEVSPEPQLLRSESSQSQGSGVPCIANVEPELPKLVTPAQALPKAAAAAAGEVGERKRRGHSFGKGSWACAQNGKWIRTDSEFVVLEM